MITNISVFLFWYFEGAAEELIVGRTKVFQSYYTRMIHRRKRQLFVERTKQHDFYRSVFLTTDFAEAFYIDKSCKRNGHLIILFVRLYEYGGAIDVES
ncbi:hypothetical protein [Enterococcus sp. BWR-S5]|uniref:hypothetical protein n=1 Tax=Enterococcus sp. BWR-S5 TaxID=2787714 RepID=UPI001921542C|nr:hypothetical protein [Enterococcus sp. BWR-S5]MBL1224224.1 hypothetical protein [Enterococcus sp. BWR-S5]